MHKTVSIAVGTHRDDARRELGILGGLEQGAKVRPPTGDQNHKRQHALSLRHVV
jgi:hypothetical protein